MVDLKRFTLLVVDDEEILREAYARDFRRKGFTVLSAKNGSEAFELVKTRKIDLVLSDVRMPGGDGLTLLEQIRAYDPKIPFVIFITGFSDVSEEEFVVRGATHVFPKPFDRKKLAEAVFAALGIPFDRKAA